jgi:hypothetical protein
MRLRCTGEVVTAHVRTSIAVYGVEKPDTQFTLHERL